MPNGTLDRNIQQVDARFDTSGATKTFAIFALILSILGFVIPVVGVSMVMPVSIVLTCLALNGGDFKGFGIWSTVLNIINAIISLTFWALLSGGGGGTTWAWIIIIGLVLSVYMVARKIVK